MGKYEALKEFPEKQFRRLTGVQRSTFEKMVSVLLEAQQKRYRKAGRKGNLSIEDKLLMALEYLREYRNTRKRAAKKDEARAYYGVG